MKNYTYIPNKPQLTLEAALSKVVDAVKVDGLEVKSIVLVDVSKVQRFRVNLKGHQTFVSGDSGRAIINAGFDLVGFLVESETTKLFIETRGEKFEI